MCVCVCGGDERVCMYVCVWEGVCGGRGEGKGSDPPIIKLGSHGEFDQGVV